MNHAYDFLIVGSGLFGSAIARMAADCGKRVLVIERRDHVGGNCWSFKQEGIDVHAYGPHLLHTNEKEIWDWFGCFDEMVPSIASPIANFKGELYNLPFNMNTFYALWGIRTPAEAREAIESQRVPCDEPSNLEEHVLDMVGTDIYRKMVKGYTEKQYGKPCSELPASVISRMPVLFTFCNDYSNERYQGVPEHGWDAFFNSLLDGIEVRCGVDYLEERHSLDGLAAATVYTGAIDAYYGYRFGPLEYRGRKFEHRVLDTDNFQGCELMNYTDAETPWLRTIEHKHFTGAASEKTVVTYEYATPWAPGEEPYYTVNDDKNQSRYALYARLARTEPNVFFGGRLAEYRYYDMQNTIRSAWRLAEQLGLRSPVTS